VWRIEGASHLLRGASRGSVSSTERPRKLAHSPNKDTHICRSVNVSSVPGGVTPQWLSGASTGRPCVASVGVCKTLFHPYRLHDTEWDGNLLTGTREGCEGTRQFPDVRLMS